MDDMQPLLDSFGRVHNNLRLSVTDRCNIRCTYCMPAENVRFMPKEEILTFEELTRFVRVVAPLGVDKLRLTGGEPLVRHDLAKLVRMLVEVEGIREIALTTNGILLADQVADLREAGLHRINVSLDALSEETFRAISRRDGLHQALTGLAEAKRIGFDNIRLNAVSMRGVNEDEIIPLAGFAREHGYELRFIEFMPLDADDQWEKSQVLSGEEVRTTISQLFGDLLPVVGGDPSQPATDFEYADGGGRVGFINSVTEPFCHACNRLRLTAEGKIRNCLFATDEWDARDVMRSGADDAALEQLVRDCVAAKRVGHGIDDPDFVKPQRAMYQIGG